MTDVEELKEKRRTWEKCLSGEDPNSVFRQVSQMTWDTAVYRVILKARELAPCTDEGVVQVNALVSQFIDKTFWESQLLATRRLVDPRKDVHSLESLIRSLKKNSRLLTRKNIFGAEGLEYDEEEARRKEDAIICEGSEKGEASYIPREISPRTIACRHKDIDVLSGVSSDRRSPYDTVRTELFDGLQAKLNQACERVQIIVNKFVAHSATHESRAKKDADAIGLELCDLTSAHEALCKTTKFLFRYILNRGLYVAPFGSDHPLILAYLDRPMAMPEDMVQLREAWNESFKQSEAWEPWLVSDVLDTGQPCKL